MKSIPRRKFIQGTALAGGALLLLPPGLAACSSGNSMSSEEYFLKEFGIDETLCTKMAASHRMWLR
jgi:hypothetical protein